MIVFSLTGGGGGGRVGPKSFDGKKPGILINPWPQILYSFVKGTQYVLFLQSFD
jgi:hypothetical protein